MKNILKYSLLGLGVLATTSCIDTLDTEPKVFFDSETIWGNKNSAEGFVYAAYNDIIWNGYAGSGSCVEWEARTPNGVRSSQVSDNDWDLMFPNMNNDPVAIESGISTSNNWGASRFSDLRRANMIIENVEVANLPEETKKQLKAHGHLLRGMIFFQQARLMGRFVPVTQVFDGADSLTCKIPLTKDFNESYDYVIKDLQYAAENMEDEQPKGVPTKWAAKVILSRAALQAYAYTGNDDYVDIALNAAKDVVEAKGHLLANDLRPDNSLFNETAMNHDEILWAYYREDKNTQFVSFLETMRTFPNAKPGDIGNNPYATPMKDVNGITFEAWGAYWPTQDLVDQFLVEDAKSGKALPWYETSQWKDNVETLDPENSNFVIVKHTDYKADGSIKEVRDSVAHTIDYYPNKSFGARRMPCPTDLQNTNPNYPAITRYATLKEEYLNSENPKNISQLMYENRDKRFYTTVVYDGCTWFNEKVELFHGGNLYRGFRDKEDGGWYTTTTNYYWRKSSIESFPRAYHNLNMAIHFNLARVGEAYMNLAEAYLLKGQISNAVDALNQTRTIHGGIAGSTATTEEEAWADYIRERNCEMVNEGGDIYFSYLRWGKYGGFANEKQAPGAIIQALNRPVHIIQIDHNRQTILVNQLTVSRAAERKFSTRRYLLPIQQSFLDKRQIYGIQDNYTPEW